MSLHRRLLFISLAGLALLAGLWLGYARLTSPSPAQAAWLYALRFPLANGELVEVGQIKGQRLTVLNFWASWCPPCVEEMPELSRIHSAFQSEGVVVLGLAIDSPSAVRSHAEAAPVNYPLLVAGAAGTDLAQRLGNPTGALPYTVLLNAQGQVLKTKLGRIREDELRSWLKESR